MTTQTVNKHDELCDQPNCDYVASHEKPAVARRMLGMHKRKRHGIMGRDTNRYRKPKKVRESYSKAARNGVKIKEPQGEEVVTIPIDMVPNFCYHCGAPQKGVTVSNLAHSKRNA
jgi:hypothetical protein